jgi:hypothetical protein
MGINMMRLHNTAKNCNFFHKNYRFHDRLKNFFSQWCDSDPKGSETFCRIRN